MTRRSNMAVLGRPRPRRRAVPKLSVCFAETGLRRRRGRRRGCGGRGAILQRSKRRAPCPAIERSRIAGLSFAVVGTRFRAGGQESLGAEAPPTSGQPGALLWEGLQPRGFRLRDDEPALRPQPRTPNTPLIRRAVARAQRRHPTLSRAKPLPTHAPVARRSGSNPVTTRPGRRCGSAWPNAAGPWPRRAARARRCAAPVRRCCRR